MLESYYRKNYKKQVANVRKSLNRKCDAEDIVQNAYLKACTNLDKFDPERGSFEGWFWAILRNTLYKYYKDLKRERECSLNLELFQDDYLFQEISEERITVLEIIGCAKNQNHREALYNYFVLQHSLPQVEKFTGMKEAAFRKMVQRLAPKYMVT